MQCGVALAAVMALAVAGCVTDGGVTGSVSQPRTTTATTFAFESIDGPPPDVFHSLVQALSVEAETQQVPVISREAAPGYRVRGYLSAHVLKNRKSISTSIAWAWDVYDSDGNRVRRVAGEEKAGAATKNAWNAANSDVLRRIAKSSLEQLAGLAGTNAQPAASAAAQPEQTLALAPSE